MIIASNGFQPTWRMVLNSTTVTNTNDTAPVASETISTGRNTRLANAARQCRIATPTAMGSVIVPTRTPKIARRLKCKVSAPGIALRLNSQINGVSNAEANGNSPVSPAASARSARAIRAKTGTTGANGDAANSIMPIAISVGTWNARINPTVTSGTAMKFSGRIQPR